MIMHPDERGLACLGLATNSEPQEVWRKMNTRSVLSLDTLSVRAVVNKLEQTEPPLCLTISVGELCVFACKDSFSRFNKTVGEVVEQLTALSKHDLDELRQFSVEEQSPMDERETEEEPEELATLYDPLDDLRKRSVLRPAFGSTAANSKPPDFLLDGYDWTTIDGDELGQASIPPGEEQAARWFGETAEEATAAVEPTATSDLSGSMTGSMEGLKTSGPLIISQHFTLNEISDPLNGGDMGVSKILQDPSLASVKTRVIIKELGIKLRFFDGYDWPELLHADVRTRACSDGPFVLPEVKAKTDDADDSPRTRQRDSRNPTRKAQLLGNLLGQEAPTCYTFQETPLPEERSRILKEQAEFRRLARRPGKYFQVAASGISCRIDSFASSTEHRLSNCTDVKIQDFFLAETISGSRPVKMIGEWFNEEEHPRDSNAGLAMVKVSCFPVCPSPHSTLHPSRW